MKLVLYSGGDIEDNEELDLHILRLIGKRNPSFTFIPSSFEESHYYFEDFVKSFSQYGVNDFFLFPIDVPFNTNLVKKAFSRDLVFLSGGNTYYFLKNLKNKHIWQGLNQFVKRGGVLAGMSAGSIVMTPQIHTASFPDFDKDDNEVKLKNFKALDLTNFEFFPHFLNSKRYIEALRDYSWDCPRPIYAFPDGAGLVIEDESLSFVGRCWCFFRGERFLVY